MNEDRQNETLDLNEEQEPSARPNLMHTGTSRLPQDLSARQISALPHLLRPGSLTAKARAAGIGRATLYRWLEDENFRVALQSLREETLHVAESEIQAMSYEAAEVLYESLRSNDKRLKFRAAGTILQHAQQAHYGHRLEQRFDALHEAANLRKNTVPKW